MNRVSKLRGWLDERTARERGMLGVCALLLVLVLGWLTIYRPVHAWREASADLRAQALSREAALGFATRGLERPGTPPFDGDLEGVAHQRAEAAGLTVTFGMAENGDLGFLVERTSSGGVMTWLAGLEQAGIRVTSLSVVENADTTITAEGALTR